MKSKIEPSSIMYITHRSRKTVLKLNDGREAETYIPLKFIFDAMPEGAFLNITKGVVISKRHIRSIDRGIYTMSDGTDFKGRVRSAALHKNNSRELSGEGRDASLDSQPMYKRFCVMDAFPFPFCAVELIYDSAGRVVDYIFRYVNRAMTEFEGLGIDEMVDRSYFDVFKNADQKWLDPYKDTVDKGTHLEADEYSDRNKVKIKSYNYAIEPGLVGCMIMVQND